MKKILTAMSAALALAVALVLQSGLPAAAVNAPLGQLVNDKPSAATPNILDGMNYALAKVGSRVIAGGSFTQVAPPGSTTGSSYSRIVAFDATTGDIDNGFKPVLDNTVRALAAGPTADTVYVGGVFTTINGARAKSIALLDTRTGQMVPGFNPPSITGGGVFSVRLAGGRLYIGGTFTKVGGQDHAGLATLDPRTGALDPYMDLQLAGHHNYTGGDKQAQSAVGTVDLDITPDASQLVVIGNFTTVSGTARDQIARVDLGADAATLDTDWSTQAYTARCFDGAFDTYMKDVDFAPDGSYFVVVATGGSGRNADGTNSSCDAAARYETGDTGTNVRPTWITYTGQDTLSSVAVTSAAVYIGGHQRWLNNSTGYDYAGQAAVPRPGLGALDPTSGVPLSWNPGRNPRGVGAYALLATPDGLYVGSDTPWIGDRQWRRERVAFFPLAGGKEVPVPRPQSLPSNVYLGGPLAQTRTDSNVLFRVDAGGPAIASNDGGPDWMADASDADAGASYRNTGSSTSSSSPGVARNASVPANTPNAIFDTERWDGGSANDGGEMQWHFPVSQGTAVQVRLYFANRYTGTSQPGQRVFDVSLDGNVVLDDYDIVRDVGDQTGTMKSFDVTSDGQVDISFGHVTENPLVNGIEIVKQGTTGGAPAAAGPLVRRSFDGTTAGSTTTVPVDGMDWSRVRGAFVVNDQLFYGSSDGNLYERTFDDSGFGAATVVDPYDDPKWSDVETGSGQTYRGAKPALYGQFGSVTGMFFSGGKVYYTLLGKSTLYSRWFSPESGILGSDTFQTSGVDFSSIAGMFFADGHIYYADRTSGDLKRVAFAGGALDAGSVTTVSGPSLDGNSWSSRGMFLGGAAQRPNQAPVAAFSSSCQGSECSFDASGSSDSDGSVASYDWEFGDGSTARGVAQSHSYSQAGDYTVTLTVTDNDGAVSTVQHQVSAATPPAAAIGYVGGDYSDTGAAKSKSVTVPDSAQVGDTMVLFFTQAADATWDGVGAQWNQVDSFANGSLQSTVWTKTVAAGDAGSRLTVSTDHYDKGSLAVAVYSGADPTSVVAAHAGDSRTSTHVTPTVSARAGDLVLSYWSDKSSATTAWTAPKAVTVRETAVGTGAGRYSFLLGDSDTAVAAGSYGGLTATTDGESGKADMWTIALSAQG